MKKIFSLLLCAAVMIISCAGLGVTAAASGHIGWLSDYDNVFSDDEEAALRELLALTAKAADCNVGVVVSSDLGDEDPIEYTESILNSTFGADSDSIFLLLDNNFDSADHYDWIAYTGTAADRYHEELHLIYDSMYRMLETDGFFGAVVGYCNYLGGFSVGTDNDYVTDNEDSTSAAQHHAVLDDRDDMLSDYQEADLLKYMHQTAEDIACHIGIVITDDIGDKSDRQYAEDFAWECFSYGSDVVVLLINNDRSKSQYTDWIYTYGLGTEKFDPAVDGIFDTVYSGMGDYQENIADYDYYGGIVNFCYALNDVSENGEYSYYYDYHDDYDYYDDDITEDDIVSVVVPIILALVAAFIAVSIATAGYKKKSPVSARYYMDSNRTNITNRRDIYLREHTTSVRISSSSSGGGGSRGGGGGRSRSGGGGGGGRRR